MIVTSQTFAFAHCSCKFERLIFCLRTMRVSRYCLWDKSEIRPQGRHLREERVLAKRVPAALRRQRWRRPYQQSTWHRLQKRHRDEYQRSGDERERQLLTLSAITGEREGRNLCGAPEGTVPEKFPAAPLRGEKKKKPSSDEAVLFFSFFSFNFPFGFCRLQSDASDDIPIRTRALYKVRHSDKRAWIITMWSMTH